MILAESVKNILAPAALIGTAKDPKHAVVAHLTEPSVRTYYIGTNGRVSQRKRLVGEVVATVRAYTTDHARYRFEQAYNSTLCTLCSRPHVGETIEQKRDRITRRYTAFTSFKEMVEDTKGSYRPSMDVRYKDLQWLADEYDEAQDARNDNRRTYRYGRTA